jgi:membrane protein DedA with SNARE-associated domain
MGYMMYLPMPDGSPRPHASVPVAVLVGLGGVLIGDGFVFGLGRFIGRRLLARWPFRSMAGGGRQERAESFLRSHGPKVLFAARFMPGLRSIVFFTSATLAIRYRVFLFYDGLAALLSVPALVVSAWYWGEQFDYVVSKARQAENGILLAILAVLLFLLVKHWLRRRSEARRGQSEPPAQ